MNYMGKITYLKLIVGKLLSNMDAWEGNSQIRHSHLNMGIQIFSHTISTVICASVFQKYLGVQ
jgi:hypothetical protein